MGRIFPEIRGICSFEILNSICGRIEASTFDALNGPAGTTEIVLNCTKYLDNESHSDCINALAFMILIILRLVFI
jgi:hypothetical protein